MQNKLWSGLVEKQCGGSKLKEKSWKTSTTSTTFFCVCMCVLLSKDFSYCYGRCYLYLTLVKRTK